jgi:hypothetical protein
MMFFNGYLMNNGRPYALAYRRIVVFKCLCGNTGQGFSPVPRYMSSNGIQFPEKEIPEVYPRTSGYTQQAGEIVLKSLKLEK